MALKPSVSTHKAALLTLCAPIYTYTFPPTFPRLSPSWIWRNHLPLQRGRPPVLSAPILRRGSPQGQAGQSAVGAHWTCQTLWPHLRNTDMGRGTKSWNHSNVDSAPRREGQQRHAAPPGAARGRAATAGVPRPPSLPPARIPAPEPARPPGNRGTAGTCYDRGTTAPSGPRAPPGPAGSHAVFMGEAPPRRASGGVTLASLPRSPWAG